jgi:hypothetical protein
MGVAGAIRPRLRGIDPYGIVVGNVADQHIEAARHARGLRLLLLGEGYKPPMRSHVHNAGV